MKQSTKLLSLILALVMAFSCMTVIGNAAIVQSEVNYDSIINDSLSGWFLISAKIIFRQIFD